MKKIPLVMAVLDGWGIGEQNASNAIYAADTPHIDTIRRTYPAGALQASGIAVGLPWGENGDSEVGHLTLGAGKVLYQHYPRISLAIKDGSFAANGVLKRAFANAKESNSRVHIAGLLGKDNIHSSLEHVEALVDMARSEGASERVVFHVFTDGRDSPPKEAVNLIADLPRGAIGTISGRFFAMDKDLHWDRTNRVFRVLVGGEGDSRAQTSPTQVLTASYSRGITDEFIEPTVINPAKTVGDGDSLIFFNFREDSMRQLVEMFINPRAGEPHHIPQKLFVATFTRYSTKFNLPVAFPAEVAKNPLGKVLSDAGRVQLRIAETEKYAHVTYFFNGFVEPPFRNEYRVLIPSKRIVRHDEEPGMMASQVTTRVLSAISEGVYDFVLVNYANADIIAHTGNFDAAKVAIQTVDEQVGALVKAVLEAGGILVITSDHGNAESMVNLQTGSPETTHNPSPVPIYVITKGYERQKTDEMARQIEQGNIGVISDVAPTVLALMGIPKPPEMTGINLLQLLR